MQLKRLVPDVRYIHHTLRRLTISSIRLTLRPVITFVKQLSFKFCALQSNQAFNFCTKELIRVGTRL